MKLIIQIPCYNEAETLEIALNDLPKHIELGRELRCQFQKEQRSCKRIYGRTGCVP